MDKFKPGDVVYDENNPIYMFLVVDGGYVSLQQNAYDGSSSALKKILDNADEEELSSLYPQLDDELAKSRKLKFLTNISMVLAHLEVELQKIREEEEYAAIPF